MYNPAETQEETIIESLFPLKAVRRITLEELPLEDIPLKANTFRVCLEAKRSGLFNWRSMSNITGKGVERENSKNKTGNRYGYFDKARREFVITDPRTPRPWFNYMWNSSYTGLISHTGGGFSYYLSARDNRITRMRYNSLPWDRPGRYIYLKDTESGEFWSLSWAPTLNVAYDHYECRHGSGYTTIITEYAGIRAELSYFVPNQLTGEIWSVSCRNLSGRPRHLEVYAFTELLMGNALNDLINQPNDKHFTEIFYDKARQTLCATRRYWVLNKGVSVKQSNIDWKYRVMFTSTLPVTGFDSSLDEFIGKWHSEADPVAIVNSTMGNTEITSGDPCAALQSVLELKAEEKTHFSILMMLAEKNNDPCSCKVINGRDINSLRSQTTTLNGNSLRFIENGKRSMTRLRWKHPIAPLI
ncbi:MAG: hypothetical protein U5N56_08660 [Candidatus Marinimicrobia bacterium]|nr:hypothetical protein [Candidatus Neomarinimicrobiota bacterium]